MYFTDKMNPKQKLLCFYNIYDQCLLEDANSEHPTFPLSYLLRRFKNLYNIIFWVVDGASTPEELSEGFLNCAMTHQDWTMLILFFEDQERPDEAKLCLQTAQKMLA